MQSATSVGYVYSGFRPGWGSCRLARVGVGPGPKPIAVANSVSECCCAISSGVPKGSVEGSAKAVLASGVSRTWDDTGVSGYTGRSCAVGEGCKRADCGAGVLEVEDAVSWKGNLGNPERGARVPSFPEAVRFSWDEIEGSPLVSTGGYA